MKVVCISTPGSISEFAFEPPIVRVGEYYTVVDSGSGEMFQQEKPWYELQEHLGFCYAQCLFAHTSQIDETEFERNYNKESA